MFSKDGSKLEFSAQNMSGRKQEKLMEPMGIQIHLDSQLKIRVDLE